MGEPHFFGGFCRASVFFYFGLQACSGRAKFGSGEQAAGLVFMYLQVFNLGIEPVRGSSQHLFLDFGL